MTYPATMPHGTTSGDAFGFGRDGYDRAETQNLTTADLTGATVYGHDDETVGSISSLQLDTSGTITGGVIEVGEFIGMGAHSVSFPFSQLTVLSATDGADLRVNLDTTEARLRPMSFYDK